MMDNQELLELLGSFGSYPRTIAQLSTDTAKLVFVEFTRYACGDDSPASVRRVADLLERILQKRAEGSKFISSGNHELKRHPISCMTFFTQTMICEKFRKLFLGVHMRGGYTDKDGFYFSWVL